MIVEEFVDHDPSAITTAGVAFQVGQIASVLLSEGFHPVGLLGDLRYSDGRVFYIDFGSDLGGAMQSNSDGWLTQVRSKISDEVQDEFEQGLQFGFQDLN